MTHGEDAGSETHQDTAVLTYLEGLLMHPVTNGPGATATRRSEGNRGGSGGVDDQRLGHGVAAAQSLPSTNHGGLAPEARDKTSSQGGTSQHLKKARLLRSGAWGGDKEEGLKNVNTAAGRKMNGEQGSEHKIQQQKQSPAQPHRPSQEGSPLGESTLLASLLTTLNSRLQTGASSQQPIPSPKLHSVFNGFANTSVSGGTKVEVLPDNQLDAETFQGYGTASNRLKGLVRKNKMLCHDTSSMPPYGCHSSKSFEQDRASISPFSNSSSVSSAPQRSPSEAASPVSCTERLKAVANLVKTRSSPAATPSPRPSMACSQLALLLSSEAHLQQYSRQQALKAQLAGQSASERLAAMASQKAQSQDQRPASAGGDRRLWTGSDGSIALNGQSRASPQSVIEETNRSPAISSPPQSTMSSRSCSRVSSPFRSSPAQKERRSFDRPPQRPPQTCSSLLLLLLNNHNAQNQLTKDGHVQEEIEEDEEGEEDEEEDEEDEDEDEDEPETKGESVLSSHAPSLAAEKEYHAVKGYPSPATSSSATGSIDSSCTPMDLSMRPRASNHQSGPPSSFSSSPPCPLDKLTETLLNKWRPDYPMGPQDSTRREPTASPGIKTHHKVTLLQLLLNQQNSAKVDKIRDNPDSRLCGTAHHEASAPTGDSKQIGSSYKEDVRQSTGSVRVTTSRDGDVRGTPSPYSFPSPHVQSGPLDLCKSKPHPERETRMVEPDFMASKLLQNLAQCGMSSVSPSPPPVALLHGQWPQKRPSPSSSSTSSSTSRVLPTDKPSAPLEPQNLPSRRPSPPVLGSLAGGSWRRGASTASSPSAVSQIERLLERRTVLQLLLGSALHAETPRGLRSVDEPANNCLGLTSKLADAHEPSRDSRHGYSPGSILDQTNGPSHNHSNRPSDEHSPKPSPSHQVWRSLNSKNGPLLDIKIKTEPGEESYEENEEFKWHQESHNRRGPNLDLNEEVKGEPCPTDIVSKYGLLSQLLKQQSSVYQPGPPRDPQRDSRGAVEDQQDFHSSPSPKRRRLCLELAERLTSELCSRPTDPIERLNGSPLLSPKREEFPAVRSSVNTNLPARDHQSFNVLKQLLLSDNCVRGASEGHGFPNASPLLTPTAKGSLPHQANSNHKPSQILWGSTDSCHRPASSTSSTAPPFWQMKSNGFSESPPQHRASTRTMTPLTGQVTRDVESPREPKRETEAGEQRCFNSSSGSPPLSRDNPILYCMLQRGRDGQQRGEMGQGLYTSPQNVQIKKEQEVGECHDDSEEREPNH